MMIQILYTFANQAQQKQIHFKEFMFNAFNLNTCDFLLLTYEALHIAYLTDSTFDVHIWELYSVPFIFP